MKKMGLNKWCTKPRLNGVGASEIEGSSKEFVEAAGEVEGRAWLITTSLASEQCMSLQPPSNDVTGP
jgi:hypothetical protein